MPNAAQPPDDCGDAVHTAALCQEPSPIVLVHAAFQERLQLHDTEPIDVMLAAVTSVTENDVPLWLMVVAPPGSGKTEMLVALQGITNPNVHMLSKLTPQTFVSGWQANSNRQRSSLLKRLPDRTVLVIKEFTTLLKMRPDARSEILSQFREVYDGSYSQSYGTGADVQWRGKIGVLAAVTDMIDQFSPYEQMLGERFLKIRLVPAPRQSVALKALKNASFENETKQELRAAIAEYMKTPRRRAANVNFSESRQKQIAALADFIALARTSPHRNAQTREIDALVGAEGPARLALQCGLLARSLAAVRDHEEVKEEDIATTCRVGFDSLTLLRRRLLSTVLNSDGSAGVTVVRVSDRVGLSWSATKRHLEDARAVTGGLIHSIDKDRWALTDYAMNLLKTLEPYHP